MIEISDLGGGVWQIALGRPERRNALGVADYAALAEALSRIGGEPGARAILLSSTGPVFCAGNDRAEFATEWPQPPQGPVVRFLEALHGADLPIVAAVQGGAIGIGATMLLHCDLIVAAPEAFLQYPFVDLGIGPEGASSRLLPQCIGTARAMDLLLTGRRVGAEEALALGLISRIGTPADALALAQAIAAKPAAAVRETKQLVRQEIGALFETEIGVINRLLAQR
jgi:enoyl-CoA hydratase/carnithine racemase